MQNVKCTLDSRRCIEGKDICCQFCILSYAPCLDKCSGCWDEVSEFGYMPDSDGTLAPA